jgi:hypothetical protein
MGAAIESLVAELLRAAHELAPLEIRPALARRLLDLGFVDVGIYVADHEQRSLVPLPPSDDEILGIDATLAGRVYQRTVVLREAGDPSRTWFPVRDGIDRLGAMVLAHPAWDDALVAGCESLAAVVAGLLVSKNEYTDDFACARRRGTMLLGAEICWSRLPPLSFSTGTVSVAGALEPAYAVSGDAFDDALDEQVLHVAVFDGMGHDLEAARLAELMVSAYRHCRRQQMSLAQTYVELDGLLRDSFGTGRFVTAQLATLDVDDGRLEVLSAGHPGPLVVRDGHVIDLQAARPALPLGLGDIGTGEIDVRTRSLQPGDRLLCYTDGLVDARGPDGSQFGVERLVDTVERARDDTHVLAEALRRLMHTLGAFRDDVWRDDATLVMVHWTPEARRRRR